MEWIIQKTGSRVARCPSNGQAPRASPQKNRLLRAAVHIASGPRRDIARATTVARRANPDTSVTSLASSRRTADRSTEGIRLSRQTTRATQGTRQRKLLSSVAIA
jgi:hypothetical protein